MKRRRRHVVADHTTHVTVERHLNTNAREAVASIARTPCIEADCLLYRGMLPV